MEEKNFSRKLSLKRKEVAVLSNSEMSKAFGGQHDSDGSGLTWLSTPAVCNPPSTLCYTTRCSAQMG